MTSLHSHLAYPVLVAHAASPSLPFDVAFSPTNLTIALIKVSALELTDPKWGEFDKAQAIRVSVNLAKSIASTTGKAVLQHAAKEHLPEEVAELVHTDLGQHTKLLHKVNASKTAIFTDIAITGLFVMVPAHLSVLIVSEVSDLLEYVTSPAPTAANSSNALVQKSTAHVKRFASAVVLGATFAATGAVFSPFLAEVFGLIGETIPYVVL